MSSGTDLHVSRAPTEEELQRQRDNQAIADWQHQKLCWKANVVLDINNVPMYEHCCVRVPNPREPALRFLVANGLDTLLLVVVCWVVFYLLYSLRDHPCYELVQDCSEQTFLNSAPEGTLFKTLAAVGVAFELFLTVAEYHGYYNLGKSEIEMVQFVLCCSKVTHEVFKGAQKLEECDFENLREVAEAGFEAVKDVKDGVQEATKELKEPLATPEQEDPKKPTPNDSNAIV